MSQMICSHIEYKQLRYSYFGRVYLERDYTFFALLGGGPRQDEIEPVFALRGMPNDENLLTNIAFYFIVGDNETGKERWISRRQAEQWVEAGDAVRVGSNRITDPDYFGPSWLTTEELEKVYREYRKNDAPELLSVRAALAAMALLPEARLVYWFGN